MTLNIIVPFFRRFCNVVARQLFDGAHAPLDLAQNHLGDIPRGTTQLRGDQRGIEIRNAFKRERRFQRAWIKTSAGKNRVNDALRHGGDESIKYLTMIHADQPAPVRNERHHVRIIADVVHRDIQGDLTKLLHEIAG